MSEKRHYAVYYRGVGNLDPYGHACVEDTSREAGCVAGYTVPFYKAIESLDEARLLILRDLSAGCFDWKVLEIYEFDADVMYMKWHSTLGIVGPSIKPSRTNYRALGKCVEVIEVS